MDTGGRKSELSVPVMGLSWRLGTIYIDEVDRFDHKDCRNKVTPNSDK